MPPVIVPAALIVAFEYTPLPPYTLPSVLMLPPLILPVASTIPPVVKFAPLMLPRTVNKLPVVGLYVMPASAVKMSPGPLN